MSRARPADPRTIAARSGVDTDTAHGAVMPPLYLSSNYSFAGFDQKRKYDYSRSGNPTRDVLAETLAELEGGAGAVITATGMAAVDLPLSLLNPGELLIAPHDCYGGTHRLLTARAKKGHFRVAFIDQNDGEALDAALADGAKLVLIETPSNPCCASWMSPTSVAAPMPWGPRWWPTTPSCRPPCNVRWNWAPTSSSTRPPNTSTATPTWSAAP